MIIVQGGSNGGPLQLSLAKKRRRSYFKIFTNTESLLYKRFRRDRQFLKDFVKIKSSYVITQALPIRTSTSWSFRRPLDASDIILRVITITNYRGDIYGRLDEMHIQGFIVIRACRASVEYSDWISSAACWKLCPSVETRPRLDEFLKK